MKKNKNKEKEKSSDHNLFLPSDYLSTYYARIGRENKELVKFTSAFFRHNVTKHSNVLEIGSGPCIYALLAAAPYVKKYYFSDYLAKNLDEILKWSRGESINFDWEKYAKEILNSEKHRATHRDVTKRINDSRKKISGVFKYDILVDVTRLPHEQQFDFVVANFVAESIVTEQKQLSLAINNLTHFIKPGGSLLMSSIIAARKYLMSTDKKTYINCFYVRTRDIIKLLVASGIKQKNIRYKYVPAEHPTLSYYKGILLISAKKDYE